MSAKTTKFSVRLPPELLAWLEQFGGDQASAARALMTAGAAVMGYPGAARAAIAEVARQADAETLALLMQLAGAGRSGGGQAAVNGHTIDCYAAAPELSYDGQEAVEERAEDGQAADDPFEVGFSV